MPRACRPVPREANAGQASWISPPAAGRSTPTWKDDPERKLPGHDGNSNVVYDEAGTIYCYDTVSDPPVRRAMAYIGHEKSRETLKYRCPACHGGFRCPSHGRCNAGKRYGKTVRVKREIDLRRLRLVRLKSPVLSPLLRRVDPPHACTGPLPSPEPPLTGHNATASHNPEVGGHVRGGAGRPGETSQTLKSRKSITEFTVYKVPMKMAETTHNVFVAVL